MPERVVQTLRVGSHELQLERWACTWCGLTIHDQAAVARHETGCAQRETRSP